MTAEQQSGGGIMDSAQTPDNVLIVLRDADGNVKAEQTAHNLITTVGKNGIADQLIASPTISKPSHMAIGTGTEEAKVGDTTLKTELDRNALSSKTRSANVVTMKAKWEPGDGTGAITEAGIFDASSSGNMYARVVFSVVNKAAGDTLELVWTFTIGE